MTNLYVACDLGCEVCRVMVGTLHKGNLMVSETHRFENVPVQANDSLEWNIGQIYQELVDGFRGIGKQEEPVHGISCTSWGADYLLFESNGSLLTPAFHHRDPRTESVFKKVLSKVPWENVYAETGWQKLPGNTLFQIAAESRRVKRASRLLSVADGFNYLFSGAARTEESQASATQLFNPVTKAWSEPLLKAIQLSPKLLAEVVTAGTKLGELRADLAAETGLSDAQVIASCSHEIASALIGLPIEEGEGWGFLWPGQWTRIGSVLEAPFINDVSRELGFSNQLGYGGSVP